MRSLERYLSKYAVFHRKMHQQMVTAKWKKVSSDRADKYALWRDAVRTALKEKP